MLSLLNGRTFIFRLFSINYIRIWSSTARMEFWMSPRSSSDIQTVHSVLCRWWWPVMLFHFKHMLSTVLWELLLTATVWDHWSIIYYRIFIPWKLFHWWHSMYVPQIILGAGLYNSGCFVIFTHYYNIYTVIVCSL